MCGINGFNWKDEELIRKMNSAIRHRGPDDKGIFCDDAVSLGQDRLSIIDLSPAGHQPMLYSREKGASSDRHNTENMDSADCAIVFNGEIYNFQELRDELEVKGYSFTTKSDTEVILASYLEWGFGCVKRFNGMWALAVYDKRKKILFCSRDRMGKKPFYYHYSEESGKFIFSSEIKGILQHGMKKSIVHDAVDIYLSTGYIPSPLSIFEGIHKLEPRQYLVYGLREKRILFKKYYYPIPKYAPVYDRKALIDEGSYLLKDATRLRLISDVPVGAFLSGGLDSSSVVAAMAEFTDLKKLHTFSIGFDGKYDESKYMRIVKDRLKTCHHHKYYREADFEKMLNRISYYYDEPFGDYSNFPTYEVSKLARENVTVALSGDGGDEIFGGYTMHRIIAQVELLKKVPRIARKLGVWAIPRAKSPMTLLGGIREACKMSLVDKEKFYSKVGDDFVYKPLAFRKWSEEKMAEVLNTCGGNMREAIIRFDLYFNTLGDNFLTKVDRAAMANALEVRCPFLDYRFVELEAKIPVEYKANARRTKILMREMIRGLIPDEIVFRGKSGFHPPIDRWIMKPKHKKELVQGVAHIHRKGVISDEWLRFFQDTCIGSNDLIHRNYNIRMLLLIKWCKKWLS